jgi:acyl-CoA synthetase (NDP forming)
MSQMLMLARRRGVGLSALASTGNECDIDVAECIEYFAGDPATRVIVAYIESCRDGGRLARALRAARAAAKPVVVLKVGRTLAGSAATQTHTGALAGEDRIYDAVFRQFGAWRASSFDEAIDVAYVCAEAPAPAPWSQTTPASRGSMSHRCRRLRRSNCRACSPTPPHVTPSTRRRRFSTILPCGPAVLA